MCLNFVRNGDCHVTSDKCLLRERGELARNQDRECPLHGGFDVWLMQDDRILVSDLGFPSEEPKQCLALGINEQLATQIAQDKSRKSKTIIQTSQRKCLRCGRSYWYSLHEGAAGHVQIEKGYFCPDCVSTENGESLTDSLGRLGYWCG